jgi:hypothetical protein
MSRIWKERFDPAKHRDFMTGFQAPGGLTLEPERDKLIDKWVYFVRVASFTFQFQSVGQIAEARDYFSKTIHPARRVAERGLEHYWQRWFERLPRGMQGGTKRVKVLKALEEALGRFREPKLSVGPMAGDVTRSEIRAVRARQHRSPSRSAKVP